jgi:SAM-dependent methyltransferase/uncharacterized protein YbaR (Trm112 family)
MTSTTSSDLYALFACPACHGALAARGEGPDLVCTACGVEYPVRFGIPVLLSPELQAEAGLDDSNLTHKARQVAYGNQHPEDDFGVVRPRGTPLLYGRLMREKFRRSILGLEELLPGSTVLVVCGGTGMDAEFLVRAGAHVVLSDISLGAVLQARERSDRYGLDLAFVVADAEALPFPNGAVDAAYVHDGLHHLEQPALGLGEMARVARRAVSVNEPARSLATNVAMRVGLAEEIEEAGNPVMRLTIDDIVDELGRRNFRPIRPHRYAMFYRHWPGRPMRLLSRPFVLPLATSSLRLANAVMGRFGNKLAVQALRLDDGVTADHTRT